ncbi:hypothetical protein CBE89_10425 [Corynebacterium striatum]|uniref:Uncharacterized protein n=1 Tax=Corynebacterium striatum TaxID=43770 RepID=A0A2Z2J4V4_CORST|nr:DUF4185 domain-containing protein [Corynebacterium striatum]ART21854.1 hypothetical protein CBE89_10425 [Corynebacterium striatum]HCG2963294.1 DUF4185 domain-containing protein [Corynebacterium striatum]
MVARVENGDIGNRAAWQHYDNGSWGESYSPILDKKVRLSREIIADWNAIKPAIVVIASRSGWQAEQDEDNFTQLYGGYITPGSTLNNLSIVVSQWNTSNNSTYRSAQLLARRQRRTGRRNHGVCLTRVHGKRAGLAAEQVKRVSELF